MKHRDEISREFLLNRYELLNPQDAGQSIEYYPGYPLSWWIYYKKIYCNFWETNKGYGLTVWIGRKTDYSTGYVETDLTLDQLLNILDRYIPKKEEGQMSLF